MSGKPHTGSYYAATQNDGTRYPALAGDVRADVAIIGAGFTGLSTALHLAERGYDVRVIEANRVGWGASGRNGGQLIGGIAGERHIARKWGSELAGLLDELRWEGHAIVRERVATYGIDCDLKNGYLDAAIRPRHLAALQREHAHLQATGFPYETRMLSATETAELIGTNAYVGGLLNMGNGHLHPLNLCVGEARAAAALGVHIHEDSNVLQIDPGSPTRVVTCSGVVSADAVVLAGNAYHTLAPRQRNAMFPVNSFIVATEPLDDDTVARINPLDVAVCDPNFVLEYFRLSADKRMLFGGRLNYFGDDPAVIARRHRRKLARLYPALAAARIDYAWGGRIGVPVRRVPLLGRLAPNVYYCQGYSGHGVNVTHLAGRILADAVAGTLEHFDLFAGIKPLVVPGGHRLRTPLVALAIWYYRIRDAL